MKKQKKPAFYTLYVRGFLGGILRTISFLSAEEAKKAAGDAFSFQKDAVSLSIVDSNGRVMFSARRFFGEVNSSLPCDPKPKSSRD